MSHNRDDYPRLKNLGDVVRWVVDELGALCPSPERLKSFFDNPRDPAVRDIRYHVEEVKCPICNAEWDAQKDRPRPGK